MTIRLMTTADYQSVYALWSNMPGVGLNSVDDSFEGIRKYLNRNPSTSFVALESDEIAGVIMCGHDGRRGFIYHTAVKTPYRGQGIGSALVHAALDALKKEGISKVSLVVFGTIETGNRFWEKLGFTYRDDLVYRNLSLNPNIR